MRVLATGLCLLGVVFGIQATAIDGTIKSQSQDVFDTGGWSQIGVQMMPLSLFSSFDIFFPTTETDFWQSALALGIRVRKYAEDLVNSAVASLHVKEPVDQLKATMQQLVSTTETFRTEVEDMVNSRGHKMEDISQDLAALYAEILESLSTEFPAPDRAPTHQERRDMVALVIKRLENGTVSICERWGIQEESMRKLFSDVGPMVEKLIVTTGDLAEQHPAILETLLFAGAIMLLPEIWFLRPLLTAFGFGPNGPIKGSVAAWAQRRFFGATILPGSWFGHLQRAGMKAGAIWGLLGGLLAGLSFLRCR